MGLKKIEVLSRSDFDEAVVKLRLNVSDIAKETSIPRTYLSEFRNGDRRLKPEHLAKLRDYFESQGIEFDDAAGNPDSSPSTDAVPANLHPRLAIGTVCYFPIRGDIPADRVRDVLNEIERNDARAAELSAHKVKRLADWFGDDQGYAKETDADIRELFALFAANYVLMRYLTGVNNPLAVPPEQNTLHQVLLDTLQESVDRAGVIPDAEIESEAELGKAAASAPQEAGS